MQALPSLWGIDGSRVQWILTDGRAHVVSDTTAIARLQPIVLPSGTVIANTAIDWNGRRVAMVRLPLPADSLARLSLLVHEAMHVFQPDQLPRAANTEAGEGGDFLESDTARSWLFLELRALAAALTSTGEAQRRAAQDALVFRAQRDALAPQRERERLDGLDVTEGIPEYTGIRLSGTTASAFADRLRRAPDRSVSWVRAIGYWTGPAYGLLLDQVAPGRWHAGARSGQRFPRLLADVVGAPLAAEAPSTRWARYDGETLWRAERARAVATKRRVDSLRTLFLTGPMLRVVPKSMQVAFDPNGQTSLGKDGTIMRGFRWASVDGAELVAPEGALVSPMWDWVQVPLGAVSLNEGTVSRPRVIEGPGWRFTVPANWRVQRTGDRTEVRPPG